MRCIKDIAKFILVPIKKQISPLKSVLNTLSKIGKMKDKIENKFVYCVCGNKTYLEELNRSIQFLKYFSKNEIIVITDLSRNEIQIEHDNVIDVETPSEFNHHQASIYLKTGIYKYLNMSNNYCYLDSDTLVVSNEIEQVFSSFNSPISFAKDHININFFASAAVHLPTVKNTYKELRPKLVEVNKWKEEQQLSSDQKKLSELTQQFQDKLRKESWLASANVPFKNKFLLIEILLKGLFRLRKPAFEFVFLLLPFFIVTGICYIFSDVLFFLPTFLLSTKKKLSRMIKDKWFKTKGWYSFLLQHEKVEWYEKMLLGNNESFNQEEAVMGEFQYSRKFLRLKNGRIVKLYDKSEGLALLVKEKFDVNFNDLMWEHWNGGLFVFNEKSVDFLKTWHEYTMEIFNDPNWKTRDQGTLLVTVWKFGLQNHPNIPLKYNFLVVEKEKMSYLNNFIFYHSPMHSNIKPICLHLIEDLNEIPELREDVKRLKEKIMIKK